MSKGKTIVILPAEEDGWEVWQQKDHAVSRVCSLQIPESKWDAAEVRLAVSLQQSVLLPFTVLSTDEEIVRDTAQLELEAAGYNENLGEAWDVLSIEGKEGELCASAVQLLESALESKGGLHQYAFDVAARYFHPQCEGDCVAIWREQGKWSFAAYRKGRPLLVEPLESPLEFVALLPVLQAQLSYKGIVLEPHTLCLWTEFGESEKLRLQLSERNILLRVEPKPQPTFPEKALKMKPQSVVEWELNNARKSKIRTIVLVAVAMYLCGLGIAWWKLMQEDRKIVALQQEIQEHSPQWKENQKHFSNWEALSPVVTKQWPLEMYKGSVLSLPNGSQVRFTLIDIQTGRMQFKGEAQNTSALNTFRARLKKSPQFLEYKWEMKPEKQSPKTKYWEFNYTAKPVTHNEG